MPNMPFEHECPVPWPPPNLGKTHSLPGPHPFDGRHQVEATEGIGAALLAVRFRPEEEGLRTDSQASEGIPEPAAGHPSGAL